jgi:putative acetyltransferase
LEVIRAAVRVTAAADYPPDVIEAWAPLPVTDAEVDAARANPEGEVRLAAILDGKVAGVAAVIPQGRELRACYVSPDASRSGVGKSLVDEIERIARQLGVPFLDLDASLTAEPFYLKLGYEVVARRAYPQFWCANGCRHDAQRPVIHLQSSRLAPSLARGADCAS